jgi:hypothetical protein
MAIEINPWPTPDQVEKWMDYLLDLPDHYHNRKSAQKMRQKKKRIFKARFDPSFYEFLAYYCERYGYKNHLLVREGFSYPCLCFPATKKQSFEIEHPLGELDLEEGDFEEQIIKKGKEYLNDLKRSGRTIENLPIYTMDSVDVENLTLKCRVGYYEHMIETCGILEDELLDEWGKEQPLKDDFDQFLNRLKLRNILHSKTDPFTKGDFRSCGIGISTPIIYLENDTYKMLLGERTDSVGIHGDLFHVVPSFMFQPTVGYYLDDYETEFKVQRHQIEREYLEEVFHYTNVKRPPKKNPPRFEWYNKKPELLYLRKLLENGEAELLFTGIAVSLTDLRPEICTVLLIKTEDWIRNHQDQRKIVIDNQKMKLKRIDIDTAEFKDLRQWQESALRNISKHSTLIADLGSNFQNPLSKHMPPWLTVPQGAAAAFLAVETAKNE